MPKVSVIIPTFNRAQLLIRALNSVMNQTYQDFEIIIVDDASTDNTKEIIKSFRDDRIYYLYHNKNKGASAARNTGLKRAVGAFVAFLDSDDEWLQEKLMKQVCAFKNASERLGLIYTGFKKINGEGISIIPTMHGDLSQVIFTGNHIGTTSTPLIRRDCFRTVGIFDEQIPSSQDWDMWIRLAQQYHCEFIPEVLVLYYLQKDSITKNKTAKRKGYERLSIKHRCTISALSRHMKAEHYFYIGQNLWWLRDIGGALLMLIKAIFTDPRIIGKALEYFVFQKMQKYLGKLKPD